LTGSEGYRLQFGGMKDEEEGSLTSSMAFGEILRASMLLVMTVALTLYKTKELQLQRQYYLYINMRVA
jgi:hypothetical protein